MPDMQNTGTHTEKLPTPIVKPKKLRPLTYKEKAFVKHIIDNPKDSAAAAIRATYNLKGDPKQIQKTSTVMATENLAKPSVVSALAAHNNTIENTLINTVTEYQNEDKQWKRTLAVDTAKYIHDKIHGKATQKIEQTTTGVTLTIDLTSALDTEQIPTE